MMKTKILFAFILCFIFASSFASAKNFNVANTTDSLFFVNGTSGNVGIGVTTFDVTLGVNDEIHSTTVERGFIYTESCNEIGNSKITDNYCMDFIK